MGSLPFGQIIDKRSGVVAVCLFKHGGIIENAAYPLPDFLCGFQCAPFGDMLDLRSLYRLSEIL